MNEVNKRIVRLAARELEDLANSIRDANTVDGIWTEDAIAKVSRTHCEHLTMLAKNLRKIAK